MNLYKRFRWPIAILRSYQTHLNWILSLLEKLGGKKLKDILFLMWKEFKSPGGGEYTITREGRSEPYIEQEQFLVSLGPIAQGKVGTVLG